MLAMFLSQNVSLFLFTLHLETIIIFQNSMHLLDLEGAPQMGEL